MISTYGCIIVLLYSCLFALYYYMPITFEYQTITPLCDCITAPLYYYITTSLYYYITTLKHDYDYSIGIVLYSWVLTCPCDYITVCCWFMNPRTYDYVLHSYLVCISCHTSI